jgi:wyosine [tRNA(Phe)-imidazoG37] synthetase (radical SAM superfamily)
MDSKQSYLPLQSGIIYGPVNSRRLGPSLGINLLPCGYKHCTFDCVYCQYGPEPASRSSRSRRGGLSSRTEENADLPTTTVVEGVLRAALKLHSDVNYITFSGNGEASLHPRFAEMVDIVIRVRDDLKIDACTAILTNSTGIVESDVRGALMRLDCPFMKLDAGSEGLFRRINRARPEVSFDRIVEELIRFDHPNLMVQAIFFEGDPSNIGTQNVKKWANILKEIKPQEVHIYSIDRPVASAGIRPVGKDVLEGIADRAQDMSGVPVKVF